jgi:hypothetical protein
VRIAARFDIARFRNAPEDLVAVVAALPEPLPDGNAGQGSGGQPSGAAPTIAGGAVDAELGTTPPRTMPILPPSARVLQTPTPGLPRAIRTAVVSSPFTVPTEKAFFYPEGVEGLPEIC